MILLASSSPRRISLFRHLGIDFKTADPPEPETPSRAVSPRLLAERLAVFKVMKFKHMAEVVLAADTLVVKENKLYPKPRKPEEAMRMLQELSGGDHQVVTGVAVLRGDRLLTSSEMSIVRMRELTEAEIRQYVESGAAMDKAGAYGIQDEFSPVLTYEGCYQNIVGLPLCLVVSMLHALGLKPAPFPPDVCRTCWRVRELSA